MDLVIPQLWFKINYEVMKMESVCIATIKSWNIENAKKLSHMYKDKYNVFLITRKEDLTFENLCKINPLYVFFPHWSWIVPEEIYSNFHCVGFHITDLPYGRGGSPLQNLILNKKYDTFISAFKINGELDAGDIYLKIPFYVGLGSAEEILIRASAIIFFKMIPYILETRPQPSKQSGEVVYFRRRSPQESDMSQTEFESLEDIYDFIRMLDGEGYPKAYIKIGKSFKIILSEAHLKTNMVCGRFEILKDE